MKLYLGSWHGNGLPEYLSVDIDPKYNPDIVADAGKLPFGSNSVDEIYAGHILEHMWKPIDALEHWFNILKPGGKLGVVVPDSYWIFNNLPDKEVREKLLGMQWDKKETIPPEGHAYLTELLTLELWLKYVGFINLVEIDRMNDTRLFGHVPWQCGYDAYKPEGG